MTLQKNEKLSRRQFVKRSTLLTAGAMSAPYFNCGSPGVSTPMTREFGRLGMEVTTLGLGGQASIQWTPSDVDPVQIILKAFDMGVNYFDTSNVYGPSQMNYGKSFRRLDLIPGQTGYNEKLRRSMFLTSKTGLRWAKGGRDVEGVGVFTNGPRSSHTVDDVKRSLSQMFGDGQGNYPKGAYLDMVLIHSLSSPPEVDVLYEGLFDTDPKAEHIGALAALRDLRDGSNRTGLNPKEEKLIRHVGFSGHHDPGVMMDIIQRDNENLLEGMLVSINANDCLHFNMQHNVIPVAAAKNMGLIAMKVFADGAMYTKEATWSRRPEHVVRTVGSPELPSRPLVEYGLTTPGIHTAIIGIGQISEDPKRCQLSENMASAQISPAGLTHSDRREIEKKAAQVKEGRTNWFQRDVESLTPPRDLALKLSGQDGKRSVCLSWQSAYAGDAAITAYEILRDGKKIGEAQYAPQVSMAPIIFEEQLTDKAAHSYQVLTVDAEGRRAGSEKLQVNAG